ncbi:hypothetical protein, partial [Pseudomonas sp. Nvir]
AAPTLFAFALNPGAAAQPIATQGRSYKVCGAPDGQGAENVAVNTWHPYNPQVSQPSPHPPIPHESSRIWSKFVLYFAPAIFLHTRTGH